MSALGNILTGSSVVTVGPMLDAIAKTEPSDLGDDFEVLQTALMEIDPVVGESFGTQLVLARELAKIGELEKAGSAKRFLTDIVYGVRDDLGRLLFRKLLSRSRASRFATSEENIARARGVLQRGSSWRLKTEIETETGAFLPQEDVEEKVAELLKAVVTSEIQGASQKEGSRFALAIDIGQRKEQQDYVLTFEGVLSDGRPVVMALLADGFYNEGEKASKTVTHAFAEKLLAELLAEAPNIPAAIRKAAHYADKAVSPKVKYFGASTLVAYLQIGEEKFVVNVGDSRAHFLSASGEYAKVSIDHCERQTVGVGFSREDRYFLLRFLGKGMDPDTLGEPDIFIPTQEISGLIFLTSDGLEEDLGRLAVQKNSTGSLQEWADWMIKEMRAVSLRRMDNMSVGIVKI